MSGWASSRRFRARAAHAEIYENADNQRAFARLLHACEGCGTSEAVIDAIRRIDAVRIKGLGPAVANLLYFIRPTLVLPFNTAIVRGFNLLTGSKVKLASWDHYLSMREGAIRLNATHRGQLSNDLGAAAGLLFDIGSGRYAAPPVSDNAQARLAWAADLDKVREASAAAQKQWAEERESHATPTQTQAWLRDLGKALGFEVWIAANDRGRPCLGGQLADGCLARLPGGISAGLDSVRLIDVVWVASDSQTVAAAFEVEHSRSIHSGIVRMLELALGCAVGSNRTMCLVAPDHCPNDVRRQLARPAFSRVCELGIRYLPHSELTQHREALGRFGSELKPLMQASQRL